MKKPQLVHPALERRFAAPPDLLSPRAAAASYPAVDVEAIRRVGPGGDVGTSRTRFCAAGADQLPRASLRAVSSPTSVRSLRFHARSTVPMTEVVRSDPLPSPTVATVHYDTVPRIGRWHLYQIIEMRTSKACQASSHHFPKTELAERHDNPMLAGSTPKPSLAAEEPEVVHPASETQFAAKHDLLSPRAARTSPAVDVEAIRHVGPGSDVGNPRTWLIAAGADQLPRGGLRGGIRVSRNPSRLFSL